MAHAESLCQESAQKVESLRIIGVVVYDLHIEILGLGKLTQIMKAFGLFEPVPQIKPASGEDGSAYIFLGMRPAR